MNISKKKILIVEDEEDILELIKYNLLKEGYEVFEASSGEKALKLVQSKEISPDLILLDLMLPGVDGIEICKTLKNDSSISHIPVIMLTAKSEEIDIILGLEVGADDYITKPFSPRILLARIKTILRRDIKKDEDNSVIKIENLTINQGKREVKVDEKSIKLTNNEFQALYLLANKPGWVFSRHQIIDEISGSDHDVTDRAIDVLIVGLRKKLEPYSNYIETVHGVGYKFKG